MSTYGRDHVLMTPSTSTEQRVHKQHSSRKVDEEDSEGGKMETIKVYLRIKPCKCEEQANLWHIINDRYVSIAPPAASSALKKRLGKQEECSRFMFSHIFGPEVQQQQLFEKCVEGPLVEFLSGKNALVFSYGTSNCGKTYTIQGTKNHPGLIPRALHLVFNTISDHQVACTDVDYMPYMNGVLRIDHQHRQELQQLKQALIELQSDDADDAMLGIDKTIYMPEIEKAFKQMEEHLDNEMRCIKLPDPNKKYSLWISFIEIYNDALYDLLRPLPLSKQRKQLKLAEDNTKTCYIKDLTYINVNTAADAYKVMMFGKKNLQIASTDVNKRSSRSHCNFMMTLVQTGCGGEEGEVSVSRLSICDLAGAERQKSTHNNGERLKESQHINCSLLVLRRCFDRLRENQNRVDKLVIPYRESKLTKLFQKPLSGEGQVIMLVNVNPEVNYEETQQVMRTAAIARKIVVAQPHPHTRLARKRPRSMLFSASLAEHSQLKTGVDCAVLEEREEDEATAVIDIHPDVVAPSVSVVPLPLKRQRFDNCVKSTQKSSEHLLRNEVETLRASLQLYKQQTERMTAELFELKAKSLNEEKAKHDETVREMIQDMDEMKKSFEKTIQEKHELLSEAFEEIIDYEKNIDDLAASNLELRQQLSAKTSKVDELEKQVDVSESILADNIDKNEELERKVESLQKDVESRCTALEEQIASEKSKCEDLTIQFDELSKTNERLQREIITLKDTARNAESNFRKLLSVKNDELKEMDAKLVAQQTCIHDLEILSLNQANELLNLQMLNDTNQKELSDLKEALLNAEVNETQMMVDHNNKIDAFTKVNEQLVAEVSSAKSALFNKELDLKKVVGCRDEELRRLQARIDSQQKTIDKLMEDVRCDNSKASKIGEIQRLQTETYLENVELKNKLRMVEAREDKLKETHMRSLEEVDCLKREVSIQLEKCNELEKSVAALEKKVLDSEKQLRSVVSSKDDEIHHLSGLLESRKSTNEMLKSTSEELQRRNTALEKKIEEELHAKDKLLEEVSRKLEVCTIEKELLEKECAHSRRYTTQVEMSKTTEFWRNTTKMEELMNEKKSLENSFQEIAKNYEEENSNLSLQLANGRMANADLNNHILQLRNKLRVSRKEVDKLKDEMLTKERYMERQLTKTKEELKTEKQKVENYKLENERLNDALITCEAKFIEYEKNIGVILERNDKTGSSGSITYYKNELAKCERKCANIQKTLDDTVDKLTNSERQLKRSLDDKQLELNALKEHNAIEIEGLRKEVKKYKRIFEENKTILENHLSKVQHSDDFKKHFAEYQKEMLQFSKDADKFEEKVLEIENLKKNIDKREMELKVATECLAKHQKENNNLRSEIAQMKEKFDKYVVNVESEIRKDKKIKELTELVNQLRNEIADSKEIRS